MCSPRRKRGEACQFCHETCTARPPQPKYNIILKKTKRARPAQPYNQYKYNTILKNRKPDRQHHPHCRRHLLFQHHQLSDNRHYCADSTNVIFLQLRRVSRPSSPSPCGHQHPQCRIALQTRTRPEHLIFSWELPLSGCMYGEPNCFSGMKIANKSRTYKTAIVCDEECYIVKLLLLQGGHPA